MERRGAILDATVRILGTRGLGAVTHRAVASEAGVPLAATTYYFASKDELVTEALRLLVEDEIARIGARAAELGDDLASPDRTAAALAAVLLPDRAPPAPCWPSSRSTSTRPAAQRCARRRPTGEAL